MIPLALSRSPSAYSYIGVPANRARSGAGGTSRVASLFALATPYPKAPRRAPARGTSMGRRSVPGGVPARAAPTPPRRRGVACPAMRAANSSGRTFAQEKRGARFNRVRRGGKDGLHTSVLRSQVIFAFGEDSTTGIHLHRGARWRHAAKASRASPRSRKLAARRMASQGSIRAGQHPAWQLRLPAHPPRPRARHR